MNRTHLESALRIMLAHRHTRRHCMLTASLIHQTITAIRATQ